MLKPETPSTGSSHTSRRSTWAPRGPRRGPPRPCAIRGSGAAPQRPRYRRRRAPKARRRAQPGTRTSQGRGSARPKSPGPPRNTGQPTKPPDNPLPHRPARNPSLQPGPAGDGTIRAHQRTSTTHLRNSRRSLDSRERNDHVLTHGFGNRHVSQRGDSSASCQVFALRHGPSFSTIVTMSDAPATSTATVRSAASSRWT